MIDITKCYTNLNFFIDTKSIIVYNYSKDKTKHRRCEDERSFDERKNKFTAA